MSNPKHKRERLMRAATYASVASAVLIIVMKTAAWIMTDSLSLLSSLVDSVFDVVSSVVNLCAVHYALKPADDDHRFGHGKAEDIAAFAQSAFIAGSAIFIVIEAMARVIDPHVIKNETIGIAVMGVSSLISVLLVLFQRYVVKRTRSVAIHADALHYANDILVNATVALSLAINAMFEGMLWLDTVFALVIAVGIFRSAWGVGKKAFDHLMDRESNESERDQVIALVLSHPEILGVHDVRTRHSGSHLFIQFHIELSPELSLKEAHRISDEVEEKICEAFEHAEILVHLDPAGRETVSLEKGHVIALKKGE